METPYQTPPALPAADPAWREKRKFWGWNIVISAVLMVATPLAMFLYGMLGMQGTFGQLGTSGADVGDLANHISQVLVATTVGATAGLLALIWMILSIIRFCTIPKPAAAYIVTSP